MLFPWKVFRLTLTFMTGCFFAQTFFLEIQGQEGSGVELSLTPSGESVISKSLDDLIPDTEIKDPTTLKLPSESLKQPPPAVKATQRARPISNRWDLNGNAILEPKERELMERDFMARYDKNADGIIDESEKKLIMKDLEKIQEEIMGTDL